MSAAAGIALAAQIAAAAPAVIGGVKSIVDFFQDRKEDKQASAPPPAALPPGLGVPAPPPPGATGAGVVPPLPMGAATPLPGVELAASSPGVELARATRHGGKLPSFNESQAASIGAIVDVVKTLAPMLRDPGIAMGLVWALVANAWVESRLKPGAHNPRGEDSRGLFQVNVRAHPQMAEMNLYDPRVNVAAILSMIFRENRVLDGLLSGRSSIAQLTWDICYYVERPKNRREKAGRRAEMVKGWLGRWALVPIAQLDDLMR